MDKVLEVLAAALYSVVLAAIPIITRFVIDWLRAKAEEIKKNAQPDFYWLLTQAARLACNAVEQTIGKPPDGATPEERKEFNKQKLHAAIDWAVAYLKIHNIDFEKYPLIRNVIELAIEAAIAEIKRAQPAALIEADYLER